MNFFEYDNERLVDVSRDGRIRLHAKRIDGTLQLVVITENGEQIITRGPNPHFSGQLFEQGRKVLFSDDDTGNEFPRLMVYDMASQKTSLLSDSDEVFRSMAYVTQTGIAYWIEARNGEFHVMVRNLEDPTSTPQRVFSTTHELFPTPVASRDGRLIALIGDLKGMSRHVSTHVFSLETNEIIASFSLSDSSSEVPVVYYEKEQEIMILSNQKEYSELIRWNFEGGDTQVLVTGTKDFIVENARYNPHDDSLLVMGNTYGRTSIRILNLGSGAIEEETIIPGSLSNVHFTELGWLGNYSAIHQPDKIFYVHPARSFEAVFSSMRFDLEEARDAESVWFTSKDGTRVHGFLLTPVEDSDKAIIYVHGGPRTQVKDEWDPNFQAWVNKGYYVFIVNYRGSLGYGKQFEQSVLQNPAVLELEDLQSAKEFLVQNHGVNAEKVVIHGRSYGGYLTLMALVKQPTDWAAGYSLSGIADLKKMYEDSSEPLKRWCLTMIGDYETEQEKYKQRSPITYVNNLERPVLIIHGTHDTRCPPSQMKPFIDRARKLGKDIEEYWYEGGHTPLSVSASEREKWALVFLEFLNKHGL